MPATPLSLYFSLCSSCNRKTSASHPAVSHLHLTYPLTPCLPIAHLAYRGRCHAASLSPLPGIGFQRSFFSRSRSIAQALAAYAAVVNKTIKADKSEFKSPVMVVSVIKGRHNLGMQPVLGLLQQLHGVPCSWGAALRLAAEAEGCPEQALSTRMGASESTTDTSRYPLSC